MKKRIEKLFERLEIKIKRIEEYNAYIEDNRYSDHHTSYLSYDVKLHSVWVRESDIDNYLDKQNIHGKYRKKILREFDDDRLNGIFNHFIEDSQESFIGDLENDYHNMNNMVTMKEVGFYGRNGGHLCLGRYEGFLLDLDDTYFGNFPVWTYKPNFGTEWSLSKPIDELIADFKEHYGVTTQKEVYELLKRDVDNSDIDLYYKDAIKNHETLLKFEEYIERFKKNANGYVLEMLHDEIDTFITYCFGSKIAINLAESGDYSKLDSIKSITENEVITNRNARVPLDKAKELLRAVLAGIDVKGQRVGAYVVNKVKVKPNDTYIKIGCHLFSINQTKLSLQI